MHNTALTLLHTEQHQMTKTKTGLLLTQYLRQRKELNSEDQLGNLWDPLLFAHSLNQMPAK